MRKTTRAWLGIGLVALAMAGCAGEHAAIASAPTDLACAPDALRSAWWSEGGVIYGGRGELSVVVTSSHLLVADEFRAFTVRLSDGTRSGESMPIGALSDARGVRFATPRMAVDAAGRSDYAGSTDVLSIGMDAPLANVPWIVPRRSDGYSVVLGHAGQTDDHVVLLERAVTFGGPDAGLWLRRVRVSSPADEQRVDLAALLEPAPPTYTFPFGILVDETRGIAFVTTAPQAAPAVVVRVDPASGATVRRDVAMGDPAPLHGSPAVGEPTTRLLSTWLEGDGEQLYATTRDGLMHTFDASTLDEIAPPRPVGVVVANEDTYLPSLESPVAATAHGALLAYLDTDGDVVIEDVATGEITRIVSAAPVGRTTPRPVFLQFVDDGLLLVDDAGVELLRCGG